MPPISKFLEIGQEMPFVDQQQPQEIGLPWWHAALWSFQVGGGVFAALFYAARLAEWGLGMDVMLGAGQVFGMYLAFSGTIGYVVHPFVQEQLGRIHATTDESMVDAGDSEYDTDQEDEVVELVGTFMDEDAMGYQG